MNSQNTTQKTKSSGIDEKEINQCCSNIPVYEIVYSLDKKWLVCFTCFEIDCFNSDIKESEDYDMRSCNGFTCNRLERVSFGFGGKIYQNGIKYCTTCSIFMKIDGYRCPCCKSNLRSKSHTKKWRSF